VFYVFFSIRVTECTNLALNGRDIQKVHTCKYIGIRFDDRLTWINHIDYTRGVQKVLQLVYKNEPQTFKHSGIFQYSLLQHQ